ncbi:MAG: efflux RND transporter permease subunit, partial [Candidatus Cloacimonadaceae bacterium]|nr:efflux RND transporter permease subunit [Candidatus Cloacimonadaceae bacterium]
MTITAELPQGYSLEETAGIFRTIIDRVAKHKEVEHIITNIGSLSFLESGTNLASADVKLVDKKLRARSTTDMMDLFTRELSDIPNARIKVGVPQGFGGGGSPIEFFLQGQDTQRLEQLKAVVTEQIKDSPGLINLDTSTRSGRPEITIKPKRDQMADVGATVYELALALRGSVEGFVTTQYREAGNQYDVKLSLEDDAVDAPDKLRNLSVVIWGKSYLLSQLADIDFSEGTNKITHRDRFKSIQFTGDLAKGANLGDVTTALKKQLDGLDLPPGYQIVWGGDTQVLNDTVADMARTFLLAVLLTYMLLAAILESFAQPLLIMATVPLALIGVILSLLMTGMAINIFSMMAVKPWSRIQGSSACEGGLRPKSAG